MHVAVNAAMSVDGKLASREREQLAISGPEDFARVERLRAEYDAIMVGVGTVLADDPSLTLDDPAAHGEPPADHPTRIVADSRARTPPDARVLDETTETYVLVSEAVPTDHVDSLERPGVSILEAGSSQVDLAAALDRLEATGIDSLLVEGGGELIFSLVAAGLVDELSVFVGSMLIGGRDAPTLADGTGFTEDYPSVNLQSVSELDDGVLLEYEVDCENP
ncbi:2,5-diamino-6-(ribosylamino)-4(3H)-pyrimidinone 5'-phosphate reductase [Halodesulfurarchaeum formicicum]|uniref:2,5-diamino-6-(ribosylamino)-4(3H)-pyrimidinone 5'-phosphate reductase n=1 Tax=Halodesulfurarchaeum formicicum TaxID=1873524 RepID=UPI00087859F4|nr:2,5-diamino-6-(ribosylamino)-4(3H)-pyrimidinone 5'-phosphate reductase [Halodesulfurarchaeum formicicum]